MKVLRNDSTEELELSGSRSELLALSQTLRNGDGESLLTEVSDPFPYSRSLSRIEVRQTSGKVSISPSRDGDSLSVEGRLDSLCLLAENIEGFAFDAAQGDHLHVDYFPEHDYLARGSGSLVVAIDSDAAQAS
ncbi:hypothetical protein Stsp01_65290 [Streptomyces sp. NBRC 13847]|uniref:Imm32 family immunity protein n=1 Tax=Streptomyces TaxID=1883 RepID=UPI0024A299FD|nr:hypothetical protein [Streptomyces sp. NBRC 13847]GLW19786.1 hypothetical protein Stsp01_65290 [Streptomyces sp. NBRC 13847]